MSIHFVVFSRYRPMQLHGYLTSLSDNYQGSPQVSVLVKGDDRYAEAYAEVEAEFPWVDFVREIDFATDLRIILASQALGEYTCFGCDDVLFVRPVKADWIEHAFSKIHDLLGFSLRLGDNVQYGMSGRRMPPPSVVETRMRYFAWQVDGPDAHEDWAYPWEVLGTVYRTDFVQDMVAALDNPPSPSQLEDRGSRCWAEHTPQRTMGAFYTAPMVVPTVNIVQTEFGNGFVGKVALRASFLLECWEAGLRMDTQRFAEQRYNTWRVPDFFMRRVTS